MRFPIATVILLAAMPTVAWAAADSLGFKPEKHPEQALGMYIAPENSLIYRMRQPDGSTREFERVYSQPGVLRSIRGWKGQFGRDLVSVESSPDVKGGRISYLFKRGRLVGFSREGAEPVTFEYGAARPALPEEQSPILKALVPIPQGTKSAIDKEIDRKWKKSRRLQFPYSNPNRSAMLYSEIAILALAGFLFFVRRRSLRIASGVVFALAVGCLAWAGSRGAMLGFAAALLCFALSRIGFIRSALRQRRCWLAIAAVVALAAVWLCMQDSHFLSRGFKGSSSWSNKIRLEVAQNTPMMLVDAPGGWVGGDMKIGRAYLDWYQPLHVVALTGSLICDHLTRLAACGWVGRFLYVFGWLLALLWGAIHLVRNRDALPLAMWLAWGVTTTFNPLMSDWKLWIAVVVASVPLVMSRPWRTPKPYAYALLAAAVLSAGILTSLYFAGSARQRPEVKVFRDGMRTMVKAKSPKTWIVDDGLSLGGVLCWKDVRRYMKTHPLAPGVGCVNSVADLPESGTDVERLVLAGSAGDDWLKKISSNPEARRNLPKAVVFIAPPFPPEAIPPPLLKACNVRIVIGEFATWYHSAAYANAPEWVKIVPGMELYVADWMHYALGGD